jgi:hypothetical protein
VLKQKEENIIQYFIFALAQAIKKVRVLRFQTVTHITPTEKKNETNKNALYKSYKEKTLLYHN